MRLADRGAIREGLWADVVIFDLNALQDQPNQFNPRERCASRRCAGGRTAGRQRRHPVPGDLGNSFEVLKDMRSVPFTSRTVFELAVITLLPALPLTLTMISLEELVERLLKIVF